MIALVEGAIRQRTPNEIALSIVLAAFTLIFLIVTASHVAHGLQRRAVHEGFNSLPERCRQPRHRRADARGPPGVPHSTTIGALLAAIGIAGMDRALRANIIARAARPWKWPATSIRCLLDKTGTITIGNRRATQFVPFGPFTAGEVGRLAALASAADETPEGKSIVELHHKQKFPGGRRATMYSWSRRKGDCRGP